MEYKELIKGLNTGLIKKIVFSILGYAHYRHCVISSNVDTLLNCSYRSILVQLTNDGKEIVSFYKKFNEEHKLFIMKNKGGAFTLKQIWDRVHIIEVVMNEK